MIFVHELGHFLAAKWFGVRVLIFSLGFGKRLFGFKRGDTDYRVSALPFGGYVKMAGDDPSEVRAGRTGRVSRQPTLAAVFHGHHGTDHECLAGVLLLDRPRTISTFQKPAYQEQPARVGDVEPDSPAAKAGIQAGDLIVRLDGIAEPQVGRRGDQDPHHGGRADSRRDRARRAADSR